MLITAPDHQQDRYMHSAFYNYRCSKDIDYDDNPDEHYYETDGLPKDNVYRRNSKYCANDIILQQLKKSMNIY